MVRKLSNGRTYYIFLFAKNNIKINSNSDPNEVIYQIILRDVEAINDLYDLNISVALARDLFKTGGDKEELDSKLIIYNKNKNLFHLLLEFLDINSKDEFGLQDKKFKEAIIEGLNNGDLLGSVNMIDNSDIDEKESRKSEESEEELEVQEVKQDFVVEQESHQSFNESLNESV